MARNPSDSLLDSKLKTEFLVGRVRHTRYIQGTSSRKRRIQVKEVWETEAVLGRGSYGVVRRERRRSISTPDLQLPSRVRAVKEIAKTTIGGNSWDYIKELEAIVKFSRPQYAAYFVRTYGWYENNEAVFITMEYFPLGDLEKFMRDLPPFSEEASMQIVQQLLEGVECMHDNGFAHRDIKPSNILVQANSPEWIVKIADFGISKRAQDGETDFRTHAGTTVYMAPEVLGFLSDSDTSVAYSVAVDIWAIGIITVQLLLKRLPFLNVGDVARYFYGNKALDLEGVAGVHLSHPCRDFLRELLRPIPNTRPRAVAARQHPWLTISSPTQNEEESLFVEDDTQDISWGVHNAATPFSVPSLAWSNINLNDNSMPNEAPSTLQSTYRGPPLDASVLIDKFRDISLETTKYFVLRSDNPLDIETSIAHGTWTSSARVNKILDNGFTRANGHVVLFFSVIKSRKFCGVARMASPVDWNNTDDHWQEDSWRGRFDVDWLCLTEISFDKVKTIPVRQSTPGFRAVACYDGTEISADSAFRLLRAISAEEREAVLRRAEHLESEQSAR